VVELVRFELEAFGEGDADFRAGEFLGGVYGVDAGEFEDEGGLVVPDFFDGEQQWGGPWASLTKDAFEGFEAFGVITETDGREFAAVASGLT